MQKHLNQARYNEKFLSEIEKNFPESYFDWKISVCFYIAIHYVDAYFSSHSIRIYDHSQRRDKIEFGEHSLTMDFIDNYDNLYNICKNSRYHGFLDEESFCEHQKNKFKEAKKYLRFIKKYIKDDLDQIT